MIGRTQRPVLFFVLVLFTALAAGLAGSSELSAATAPGRNRYMVVAKSKGEYAALRSDLINSGARIIREMPEIETLVVVMPTGLKARAAAESTTHARGMAQDQVRTLIRPQMEKEFFNSNEGERRPDVRLAKASSSKDSSVTPDPAFDLRGLMWNVDRIGAPQTWKKTTGSSSVLVGVADTGLDFTHSELASQIEYIEDLTAGEDSPICETYFGMSDADNAAEFGGPALTDWNGHGSWIGGNIAAALNGKGINGIAPGIRLVGLKISQWCGYAWDSTIIASFLYAANNGIDVVSISFGGYLDRSIPSHDLTYRQYAAAVQYALDNGTAIVAAAGNEHVRVGAGGKVLSHGSETTPGSGVVDYYGRYEVPAGIPGVVMVSATGNVVKAPSARCPGETADNENATCKPASDKHQPFGVGSRDQLAYYSNYGPRIDVAAPGGARKFNLPYYDRGGTPGWPITDADKYNVWEAFSTTSNWALEIPCYWITGAGFPRRQCYTTLQGTSVATPHVSATLALIASREPFLRHQPKVLIPLMKLCVKSIDANTTPPLSATDKSPGDLTGVKCYDGYCHLGGTPIPYREAFGAGLIDTRFFQLTQDSN